ncbi:MAG: DUF1460 domain-containing protein [Gemmatimonadetes bacterium]|nr:DUF1460 domain-containing protein [Gemmatimonadota bacterium]
MTLLVAGAMWLTTLACSGADAADGGGAGAVSDESGEAGAVSGDSGEAVVVPAPEVEGDTIPGTMWTEADWRILDEKIRWADAQGLDTLPIGQAVAILGSTFVGTTYTPGTLEAPGPEHIVVNLRELDCVTFIENVWALTRFHRAQGVDALADAAAARAAYEGHLEDIRYRDGQLSGYPSRLHYFSDWLWNHEDRGHLDLITDDLGGVADGEEIDFMSTHPDAYRQLADPAFLAAIREREAVLNARGPRLFLPQAEIAAVESRIRDGDLIAATSTVAGLDIAHTGIAIWRDGRLHLLHAPLVGRSVEISELPLADRIQGIGGQDGILVARLSEEG